MNGNNNNFTYSNTFTYSPLECINTRNEKKKKKIHLFFHKSKSYLILHYNDLNRKVRFCTDHHHK